MSTHNLTVAGYVAIVAVAGVLQALSRRPGSRIPSIGSLFGRAMRTRPGRVGVIAGWAWLGLHLFAR
jgi:hypothetical protein